MDTRAPEAARTEAERRVTVLYEAHALSLARLALLMLGDSAAAQDVVQDAFLGLYRRWHKLTDVGAAPAYLRASVLNGCRTVLKQRSRVPFETADEPLESAEAALIHTEEQRAVLAAVRRLPARQTVVCAASSYSASDKRLSAIWLAYPLATPARPRVLGRVQVPPNVKDFASPNTVEWTNATGTEVLGSRNTQTVAYSKDFPGPATTVTNHYAFIGGGKIRPFPWVPSFDDAW